MKNSQKYIYAMVLSFGVVACGGDDEQVDNNRRRYKDDDRYTFNESNQGSYGNMDSYIAQQLQYAFGSLKTSRTSNFSGSVELKAGTHSWKEMIALTRKLAQQHQDECSFGGNWGGGYQSGSSVFAEMDFSCLAEAINLDAQDNVRVIYQRGGHYEYNLPHAMEQLFYVLSYSYGYSTQSWYGWGGYYPYYTGNNLMVGVDYGSSGLSIGFSGSWGY
jgi:hypothetical protein